MSVAPLPKVPLLQAHAHQWGPGKIHRFDIDKDRTFCGRKPEACPGDFVRGDEDEVTCSACRKAMEK
jgi:hypothetical protein